MNHEGQFNDRVAIITGAGSGIGEATARLLHQRGGSVVLVGRSDKVGRAASEIKGDNTRVMSIMADLTNENEVKSVVETTVKKFGKVDILINSAGITGGGNIETTTLEEWEYIHKNNGTITFLCCKYVIAEMKKRRYGKVVNVSSIAGRYRGITSGLHYAYAKSGLLGFTRQLGAEVAPWQINVNCMCPSQTMTQMLKDLINPEIEEHLNNIIPLKRIAQPEEQAAVIAFLASDDSSYMAGALVDSNGGQI
jgi:NAD(P)-dependent dehydrogenase (short-subunit alcohol dehydrogenase family)